MKISTSNSIKIALIATSILFTSVSYATDPPHRHVAGTQETSVNKPPQRVLGEVVVVAPHDVSKIIILGSTEGPVTLMGGRDIKLKTGHIDKLEIYGKDGVLVDTVHFNKTTLEGKRYLIERDEAVKLTANKDNKVAGTKSVVKYKVVEK